MDNAMLKKMKDKGDKMSPEEAKAKEEVLQELIEMMQNVRADRLKSGMDEMQKVSVMAPDKEHLSEGLDKAKELLGQMPEMHKEEGESMEDELSEEPEMEAKEMDMGMEKLMPKDEEEDEGQTLFRKRK
jgi:hypothetical protein